MQNNSSLLPTGLTLIFVTLKLLGNRSLRILRHTLTAQSIFLILVDYIQVW
jgi:hypothetical protein